jgi:hypothetical protein
MEQNCPAEMVEAEDLDLENCDWGHLEHRQYREVGKHGNEQGLYPLDLQEEYRHHQLYLLRSLPQCLLNGTPD